MDGPGDGTKRRAKVGHKKSRNGCQKCKTRRVKCDEKRPLCGNCKRLALDCSWPGARRPTPSPGPVAEYPGSGTHFAGVHTPESNDIPVGQRQAPPSLSDAATVPETATTQRSRRMGIADSPNNETLFLNYEDQMQGVSMPESRERRLLEHRLMQNYLINMASPFPVNPSQEWKDLFGRIMPALALKYDNVLYSMCAQAAAHMLERARLDPARDLGMDHADVFRARQTYLVAALREQRIMVDALTKSMTPDGQGIDVEAADAVCFASLLLLIHSFAALSGRELEPYAPPMEWVAMGRGAGALIWMSVEAVRRAGAQESSRITVVANSYPRFGTDESYYTPEMRRVFAGVLTLTLPGSGDDWDDEETRDAYEKALSYVGSVQNAINTGEPVYAICRRIQAFSLLMPKMFIAFLEEMRPRALVILAHFFATVAQVQGIWWLGEGEKGEHKEEGIARREIKAISNALPPEWKSLMVWPLDIAGLR